MTAIILAGGKAIRLGGCDKAFLKIGEETLINRQLKLLKKIFKKIIIVTNSPKVYKKLTGVRIVSDIIPRKGPLGGVYSGLLASEDNYNFVIACDMPFLNLGLIKFMYRNAKGYDIVVPRINNRYQPLFSIYSKNCLEHIKQLLDKEVLKIRRIFSRVKIREITDDEVRRFGYAEKIFMNINTPEDLNNLLQS